MNGYSRCISLNDHMLSGSFRQNRSRVRVLPGSKQGFSMKSNSRVSLLVFDSTSQSQRMTHVSSSVPQNLQSGLSSGPVLYLWLFISAYPVITHTVVSAPCLLSYSSPLAHWLALILTDKGLCLFVAFRLYPHLCFFSFPHTPKIPLIYEYDIPIACSGPIISCITQSLARSSAVSLLLKPLWPEIQNSSTVRSSARLFGVLWHSRVNFISTLVLCSAIRTALLPGSNYNVLTSDRNK